MEEYTLQDIIDYINRPKEGMDMHIVQDIIDYVNRPGKDKSYSVMVTDMSTSGFVLIESSLNPVFTGSKCTVKKGCDGYLLSYCDKAFLDSLGLGSHSCKRRLDDVPHPYVELDVISQCKLLVENTRASGKLSMEAISKIEEIGLMTVETMVKDVNIRRGYTRLFTSLKNIVTITEKKTGDMLIRARVKEFDVMDRVMDMNNCNFADFEIAELRELMEGLANCLNVFVQEAMHGVRIGFSRLGEI